MVLFCFVLFWCVFSLCLVFLSSSFPEALDSFYLSTNGAGWSNKENWVCVVILFWELPFFLTVFSLLWIDE